MLLHRLVLLLLLLPLLLDLLACACIRKGSVRRTLSSTAWECRSQKYFHWTHSAIDFIFWPNHCQQAWEHEEQWGSAGAYWLAQFMGRTT